MVVAAEAAEVVEAAEAFKAAVAVVEAETSAVGCAVLVEEEVAASAVALREFTMVRPVVAPPRVSVPEILGDAAIPRGSLVRAPETSEMEIPSVLRI